MPAFLVELPASGGKTLIGASDSLVVFALNAADARAMAANAFDGDSNPLWLSAQTTVTEIIEGVALPPGFEFEIRIVKDGSAGILAPTIFTANGGAGNVAFTGGVIGASGGLLYVDDEVATIVGGTFTRAATFRCEGTGAVTAIEMMDPGEYTVLPSPFTDIATTSSLIGDDALVIDGAAAVENSYEVLLGQMVTLLNAHAEIVGADLDMSNLLAGNRIFTLTSGGGGDDLGDSVVLARLGVRHSGDMPGLLGTITSEGASDAVLAIDIPDLVVIPQMLRALKSGN